VLPVLVVLKLWTKLGQKNGQNMTKYGQKKVEAYASMALRQILSSFALFNIAKAGLPIAVC